MDLTVYIYIYIYIYESQLHYYNTFFFIYLYRDNEQQKCCARVIYKANLLKVANLLKLKFKIN